MNVENRLLKVMRKTVGFEGDAIDPEDDFFDGTLLFDSIDMLEIVLGIKKEFGLEIVADKGEAAIFRNFREMTAYVSEMLEEKNSGSA